MSRKLWLGHHDFVPTAEIREVEAENRAIVEREQAYTRQVTDFRVRVLEKLQRHGALTNGEGWALFRIGDADEEGKDIVGGVGKEILLVSYLTPDPSVENQSLLAPCIRILTNEPVSYCRGGEARMSGHVIVNEDGNRVMIQDGLEWVAEDLTIDDDNAAQYLIDAVALEIEGSLDHSYAPVFLVGEGGELKITKNFLPSTPVFEVSPVNDHESTEPFATPFGNFGCLEDRQYALAVAEGILAEILELKPVHFRADVR